MHVSANGMISLGKAASDQLTFDKVPMIAPWLADLDTQLVNNDEIDGTIFYRTALNYDSDFDQWAYSHFGINFYSAFNVIVTYDRVKAKGDLSSALRNTFQANIHVSHYGDTIACFNYPENGLNWPDQSQSFPYPIVGFFSGPDLQVAYYLPGSGSADAVNLDQIPGNFGVVGQFCYLVSGLEVADSCLITSLTCRAPSYFHINTPLTSDDVLSTYSKCDAQDISLNLNTFTCNDVGNLLPITATIGSESCTAWFIPSVDVALAYQNCPADITVYSSDPTTVHWEAPIPVGDCYNGQQSFSYYPDLTVFPVGRTLVTYYAYDIQGHSTLCSFEVTVTEIVSITYEVIDLRLKPIANAAISAYPDCSYTDAKGFCTVEAPNYHVGDTIPAGYFYITLYGNVYVIRHDSIEIDCFDTKITIILSPPGFYRTAGGDILPCTAGSYSNQLEATGCISCPAGWFQNDDYSQECFECPQGFTSGEGAAECYYCSAGSYLDASGQCLSCPAGTYSCDRAVSCDDCPEGSWSNSGATVCQFCSAGFYLDVNTHNCNPCPADTFSGERATICTACPYGSYAAEGSVECTFCVAGFYLDPNHDGVCTPCPGGYYSCDRATSCTPCPQGGFASPGSAECSFCTAGYYMGMENDEPCDCYVCPAGTYSCDASTECEPCPPGTWSMAGSATCFACYAGYYLDIDCGMCELCPPNTFSADNAFEECTPCPPGSYSSAGATYCTFCIAGYYFNENTQQCDLCPAGTFSNERATECTPCPPGSYSFPGSDTCLFCTAGYYLDQNSQTCIACPAGTISCERATECTACPDGSFSYPGSATCTFCDAGYFFDELSQICLPCPTGTFSNDRASVCTPCPAGFTSLPGSAFCYACTAGTYLDLDSGSCFACPPGFTSGDRALECFELPVPPINEVIPCPAGFYRDVATQNCLPCPANSFSQAGADQCIPCPTGSYSTSGSATCIFCTAGYYLDTNRGMCLPCAPNTYSADRATTCIPCPYGWTSDSAASFCTNCTGETIFNPQTMRCEPCPSGDFFLGGVCLPCSFAVPEVCQICPPGKENELMCAECCAGYYSPDGVKCVPCPEGQYSGSGFSFCVTCPPGMYWDIKREYCVHDYSSESSGGH